MKKNTLWAFFSFLLLISCDESQDENKTTYDMADKVSDAEVTSLQQDIQRDKDIFYFGFDLRSSPQEDARQYLPFLNYLSRKTGYKFFLHFTPKNSSTADELGQNITDFAAMGASSILSSQSKYDAFPIVLGLNKQGKAEYRSFIVIDPQSPIKKVSELKGKSFSFGSPDSTQGHLIPRIILFKQDIKLDDLSHFGYTGSHQNCANGVVSGKFDACGMQDTMARIMESQGLVKILHRSDYYPSSGIVANKNVSADVVAKVTQALLDFKPEGAQETQLYNWDKTEMPKGFIKAHENVYDSLRSWSYRLGFLEKKEDRVDP